MASFLGGIYYTPTRAAHPGPVRAHRGTYATYLEFPAVENMEE